MNNFYCPYCNPKYQFTKESPTGELICGVCGEALVKKPYIRINQIVAIIVAISFLLPLIYAFIFLIRNQITTPRKHFQANINSIHKIYSINLITSSSRVI